MTIDYTKFVVHCKESEYDVYAGRPSKWGNKYSHLPGTLAQYQVTSREEAIERHKQDVLNDLKFQEEIKKELKGKVLGCFCRKKKNPLPCHCDILAQIANEK